MKYKEIQRNTEKYKEIQINTKKYKEIQRNTNKCIYQEWDQVYKIEKDQVDDY